MRGEVDFGHLGLAEMAGEGFALGIGESFLIRDLAPGGALVENPCIYMLRI